MKNNCYICNSPIEFLPKSKFVDENSLVRCTNKYCLHNSGRLIDAWKKMQESLMCPICGAHADIIEESSNENCQFGCCKTEDCFFVGGKGDLISLIQRWNIIVKKLQPKNFYANITLKNGETTEILNKIEFKNFLKYNGFKLYYFYKGVSGENYYAFFEETKIYQGHCAIKNKKFIL